MCKLHIHAWISGRWDNPRGYLNRRIMEIPCHCVYMVHLVHEIQLKLEHNAVRPSLLNIADDLHALRNRLAQVLHGEI